MDITIVDGAKAGEPFEYFCRGCLQLRFSACAKPPIPLCGNCGGFDLVIGKPGELDKEKLLKEAL